MKRKETKGRKRGVCLKNENFVPFLCINKKENNNEMKKKEKGKNLGIGVWFVDIMEADGQKDKGRGKGMLGN